MSSSLERASPSNKRPALATQNQMSALGAHSSKYGIYKEFQEIFRTLVIQNASF